MQARGGGKSKEHLEAGMSVQGAARNVEGTASGDEDKEGETERLEPPRRFFVLVSSSIRYGLL